MKSQDWSIIAFIVVLSAGLSVVVSNFAIKSVKSDILKVEKVAPISPDFVLPNKKFFNEKSLNLTQEIKIGEDQNVSPFKRD